MEESYIEELYELYQQGLKNIKMYRSKLAGVMRVPYEQNDKLPNLFIESESLAQALPDAKHNMRTFGDEELRDLLTQLWHFFEQWPKQVRATLSKIPQRNFLLRFDAPFEFNHLTSVQQAYRNCIFSKDVKVVINVYDRVNGQLHRLLDIIKDYEAILLPSSTQSRIALNEVAAPADEIIYRLEYNLLGELRINGLLVHKCKLGSALDNALAMAIDKPRQAIKIQKSKNVGASLGHSQIPSALRKIFFRFNKTEFILNPEITTSDLAKNCLDKSVLDAELLLVSKNMQQLHQTQNG